MPTKTAKEDPQAPEPATEHRSPHVMMLIFAGLLLALVLYGFLAR